MSLIHLPRSPFILGALALFACESNPEGTAPAADDAGWPVASAGDIGTGDGAALYDPTYVATMELEVSEDSLAILRADADQPMNFDDFTYVPARLTYDGVVFEEVGLRVKGNNSRASATGDAVPFKLDMNRYVDGQELDGQTKINLHNNVNQPAAMNDYLSYGAFRDYGIAASRTGWADVSLNGASLGLYTLVEQVNEKMLAHYYDDAAADLYKPEPPAGYLTYLGDSIEDYEGANYEADDVTDHATFLALTKTLEEEPVAAWDAVIDIESVLTYFAGNTALGNWDTYTSMGHNYYLFEATPGRMVMLPWDMNLSQAATSAVCPASLQGGGGGGAGVGGRPGGDAGGAGPDGGAPAAPEDFGAPGGMGAREAPLYDGVITDSGYFTRYLEVLADFLEGPGSVEALGSRIDVGAAALGDRISTTAVADLRTTIASRVAAIQAALPSTPSCSAIGSE